MKYRNFTVFATATIFSLLMGCSGGSTDSSSSSSGSQNSSSSSSSSSGSSSPDNNGDVARGKTLYDQHCHKCHGDNGDKPFAIKNDDYTFDSMVTKVDSTMPKDTANDCVGQCAIDVTAYVRRSIFGGSNANKTEPPKPLAARLAKPHYINSIEDIFGVKLSTEEQNSIPDEVIDEQGFITMYEAQLLESSHIQAYTRLSRTIADKLDASGLATQLAQCSTTANNCRNNLVDSLGLKLFRRPLSNTEKSQYQSLFSTVAQIENADFDHAMQALVRGMLQAPQFLYRTENETLGNKTRQLNGYELATRLAFFLWQSSPDDSLLEFAAKIESDGFNENLLSSEVDRMLNDKDKLARARLTFWSDYTLSSTSAILEATKDKADELRNSVVETLVRASGSQGDEMALQDLFTSTKMTMGPNVARDLNINDVGNGMQEYDTSNLPQRVGFLSHPGFIANIGSTSFVGRGVILTDRVLCREVASPPDNIDSEINDTATKTEDLTPRGGKDYRFGLGGICLACHATFEPVAFAFERFDVLGRYVTKDERNEDLFTYGYLQEIDGSEGPKYDGVGELMELLKNSDETSQCFMENMLKFAVGRYYVTDEEDAIKTAHSQYLASGGNFTALLRAAALSPIFRTLYVAEQ